jgi:hypothetical protein
MRTRYNDYSSRFKVHVYTRVLYKLGYTVGMFAGYVEYVYTDCGNYRSW